MVSTKEQRLARYHRLAADPEYLKSEAERKARHKRTRPADYWRESHLNARLRKVGLTPEEYARLVAERQGACTICSRVSGEPLRIDHDHTSGRFRGLLCHNCNLLLGHASDNPAVLAKAIEYLTTTTTGKVTVT